ncbi:uncharacterized protein V6R79_016291 [Siganus canaliculatus]
MVLTSLFGNVRLNVEERRGQILNNGANIDKVIFCFSQTSPRDSSWLTRDEDLWSRTITVGSSCIRGRIMRQNPRTTSRKKTPTIIPSAT